VADRTWEDPALVHYKTDLPPGTLPSTPLTQIWEPIYPDWTRWTWTAFGSTEWELAALGRFLCGEVTRKSWRTRYQIVSAAVGELQSEQLCFWEMDERKVNRRSGNLPESPSHGSTASAMSGSCPFQRQLASKLLNLGSKLVNSLNGTCFSATESLMKSNVLFEGYSQGCPLGLWRQSAHGNGVSANWDPTYPHYKQP
jgi:hypothetical protein